MKTARTWLPRILAVIFLAELILGGAHLVELKKEYTAGQAVYADLAAQVRATPEPAPSPSEPGREDAPPETALPELTETPPPWPAVDFQALSAINPDVVGWISIDGTGIDYPIVQGKDDKYYLDHLFTGEKGRAGCIFLDSENAADFSDPNSVIYGHYLNDGTMFSPLLKYKKQAYFDAHPTGQLLTPEKTYQIHFFSGFVTNVRGKAWTAAPGPTWPAEMAERSLFTNAPTPPPDAKTLTLSTCSYEFQNARFVLIGVLEDVD